MTELHDSGDVDATLDKAIEAVGKVSVGIPEVIVYVAGGIRQTAGIRSEATGIEISVRTSKRGMCGFRRPQQVQKQQATVMMLSMLLFLWTLTADIVKGAPPLRLDLATVLTRLCNAAGKGVVVLIGDFVDVESSLPVVAPQPK